MHSPRPLACALLLSLNLSALDAATIRSLPSGQAPNDTRLQEPKDLNGYFPFTPAPTKEAWERRAEEVRRHLLVSLGLWPLPEKTPLNPVIHGRIDRGDYTVEKVYFESIPGFFVTGNLYRPKNIQGKAPAVLCPHGHWTNGRFMDAGEKEVRKEIVQGAERFMEGGRSPLQARCVQLARMGCVVFHYDMLGYADSTQIPMAIAHNFAKQRPEMNTVENWGLFSPAAEANLQSVMGLQTWNSIRSLDFITGLPEVDQERIACTGASGGGTQTFVLGALDPRVKVAFPAVMVSTAMQGGCTCENASLLRVGMGNVELAAMFAPRPLAMTSANDWTKEMATRGFPELQKHFALYGTDVAKANLSLTRGEHFGHNYNYVSRSAMYAWINKHFKLGLAEPVVEEDYKRLTQQEMSVWDGSHPAPPGGPDFERILLRWLTEDHRRQVSLANPKKFTEIARPALQVVLGRNLETTGEVTFELTSKDPQSGWLRMSGILNNKTHGEAVPVVFCHPEKWNGSTLIWTTAQGKDGLFQADGSLKPGAKKLVDSGVTIVGVDLIHQGESSRDGKQLEQTPRVKNTREAAAYTLGYNRSVFAQRVHDLLSLAKYVSTHERRSTKVALAGFDETGPVAAAARAALDGNIQLAAINTSAFRFGHVKDVRSPDLLPGGAKYGDLPGMLALSSGRLWLAGETGPDLQAIRGAFETSDRSGNLSVHSGGKADTTQAALTWLERELR